jgi:hypothetical protein
MGSSNSPGSTASWGRLKNNVMGTFSRKSSGNNSSGVWCLVSTRLLRLPRAIDIHNVAGIEVWPCVWRHQRSGRVHG